MFLNYLKSQYVLSLIYLSSQFFIAICDKSNVQDDPSCSENDVEDKCQLENNPTSSYFSYLGVLSEWEAGDISDIRDWIAKQKLKGVFSRCKVEENAENILQLHSENPVSVIERLYNCPIEGSYTLYTGALDSNMQPKGNGKFETSSVPIKHKRKGQPCFSLMAGIQSIQCKFKNGVANGPGKLFYSDGSRLEVNFKFGIAFGLGKLYSGISANNPLQLIGHYVGGRLHGPAWVFLPPSSQTTNSNDEGSMLVHFEKGVIDSAKPITYFSKYGDSLYTGFLRDGYLIDNQMPYTVSSISIWQCLMIVKNTVSGTQEDDTLDPIELPFKIVSDTVTGRVSIHNPNVIFFNPLARTGSETLLWLLHELKNEDDGKFNIIMPQARTQNNRYHTAPKTNLRDSKENVQNVVREILSHNEPLVYAKPYNFVSFEEHGSVWSPDYLSIVRDPIEKVNSTY